MLRTSPLPPRADRAGAGVQLGDSIESEETTLARHRSAGRRRYVAPASQPYVSEPIEPAAPANGQSRHPDTAPLVAPTSGWPSMTEVAIYTLLGAAIASAVFVLGGRPYWHVALVVLAALVVVLLSALISRRPTRSDRTGSSTDAPDERATSAPSATSRRGRRRRR